MTTLPADTFRAAMQAHGLVLRDDLLDDDETISEELWRLSHLSAMARLALRADPGLQISADFSPDDLYAALAAALPLGESTVHSIRELLKFLAVIEQRGEHAHRGPGEPPLALVPPWEDGDPADLSDAGLDEYAQMLQLALDAGAAAQPWRLHASREDSRRKYLVSTPKDRFRGPAPGVLPDLDQIDFSDVVDDEE